MININSKWILKDNSNYKNIARKYKLSETIAKILSNRNIDNLDMFLHGTLNDLHDPSLLLNIDKTVELLHSKVEQKCKIRIIGDYDTDGVMSTFNLYKGLSYFGAIVDYVIPHRVRDGYGININLIDNAFNDKVDTIITCDNGISAFEQVEYANKLGITVIITDHHEIPFELIDNNKKYIIPNAKSIVDPKLPDDKYPFKEICGAMVTYKIIQYYISKYWLDEDILDILLESTTLAIIADVMPIIDENRVLVKYGIEKLKDSRIKGIKALINVNEIDVDKLNTYTIGFILAPCVNATGRLDSAKNAMKLLLSENDSDIFMYANMLKTMNDERKELTSQNVDKAIELIENSSIKNDKVIVLMLDDCHESIAGIIAGRIREKYEKPTFIFTKTEDNILKGSGRSIDKYNMYEEITKCKALLLKYGGHKMASGLSLEIYNLDNLRKLLNKNCTLLDDDFIPTIQIDMNLPLNKNTTRFINSLSILEPYGVSNPRPIFKCDNVQFLKGNILGKNRNVGKFTVMKDNEIFELMEFNNIGEFNSYLANKYSKEDVYNMYNGSYPMLLDIVYKPNINEFKGKKTVQIIMNDYK